MDAEQAKYLELRQREFAERFSASLETWRFEVNSYWTRNSYFALFQGGAFAALWTLLNRSYFATSAALSILGCLLTVVWFMNNQRMHEYVEYWWNRSAQIEIEFEVAEKRQLVAGYETRRLKMHCLRYSTLVQIAPCLFICAWIWTFGLSLAKYLHLTLVSTS